MLKTILVFIIALVMTGVIAGVAYTPPAYGRSPRIIDDNDTVILHGNVHPFARPEFDRGPTKSSLPMERMILTLRRSLDKEAALNEFLTELHNPASADFHNWTTPEEFGEKFGPGPEDVNAITRWLVSHGFAVEEIAKGRSWINFSGSAAQVERAFHTSIHNYYVNGRLHHANAQDPLIPRGLSDLVSGVVSLHDFPRTMMHNGIRPVAQSNVSSDYTIGTDHYLSPDDFATIYNVNALYSAGIDGSGQLIAIVGRTHSPSSNWSDFRNMMGLPVTHPLVIVNGPDPGDLGGIEDIEADLDVEWSGAVARNAAIIFVTSASTHSTDGVDLSAQYIVNNNLSPIMSTSFGSCESDMGTAENNFYNNLWQQAASQGITSFVASGDSGAAGCNLGGDAVGSGPGVNGLASTPYNVAVGGTQFNEGSGSYWNTTNGIGGSSAISYIPEIAWNESGTVSSGSGLWATGGGASSIYGKPVWQAAPGVPVDGKRDVPDVSLSGAMHDSYLVKTSGALYAVGGTSASSPSFAGLMALIVQMQGQRQGNANIRFYQLGNAQYSHSGAVVFHDITSGSNSVPGVSGYLCTAAYDLSTGLGSVDANALLNNWTPDFTVSAAPGSISVPQGGVGVSNISTSVSGNFSNAVSLSAANLPQGTTVFFSTNPIAAPGSGSSTLSINVGSSSAAGTYPLTITGDGGGMTHVTTVNLTILQVFNITSSITNGTGGTMTPNFARVVSGDSVTFRVGSAIGYHLVSLIDTGVDVTTLVSGDTYTIANVTADHEVTATFDINTYSVNATIISGNGSIMPSHSTVNYGSPLTFVITPDEGYFLQGLTDNGSTVAAAAESDGSYSYAIASVTGNHTIQATFARTAASVPAVGFFGFIATAGGLGLLLKKRQREP